MKKFDARCRRDRAALLLVAILVSLDVDLSYAKPVQAGESLFENWQPDPHVTVKKAGPRPTLQRRSSATPDAERQLELAGVRRSHQRATAPSSTSVSTSPLLKRPATRDAAPPSASSPSERQLEDLAKEAELERLIEGQEAASQLQETSQRRLSEQLQRHRPAATAPRSLSTFLVRAYGRGRLEKALEAHEATQGVRIMKRRSAARGQLQRFVKRRSRRSLSADHAPATAAEARPSGKARTGRHRRSVQLLLLDPPRDDENEVSSPDDDNDRSHDTRFNGGAPVDDDEEESIPLETREWDSADDIENEKPTPFDDGSDEQHRFAWDWPEVADAESQDDDTSWWEKREGGAREEEEEEEHEGEGRLITESDVVDQLEREEMLRETERIRHLAILMGRHALENERYSD